MMLHVTVVSCSLLFCKASVFVGFMEWGRVVFALTRTMAQLERHVV